MDSSLSRSGELLRLRDERARQSSFVTNLVDTVRSERRDLTAGERDDFDRAERRIEDIDRSLALLGAGGGPLPVPNINTIGQAPPTATRSLDEVLWASPGDVAAGTVTRSGVIAPDPRRARNTVERVMVPTPNGAPKWAPTLDTFSPEHRGIVRSFQQTVADMALFGLLVDKNAKTSGEGFQVARAHPLMHDRWVEVCRALDVDTSAQGGNWVPTGIGMSLHEKVRAAGKIAPLFARIDLPTNPWKWPIEGSDSVAYRVAEPTGDTESKMTASTPGSVAATFDAEIFGARTLFSRSVEADSAVAILPYTTAKLIRAFVTAEEQAILDGDSDGTHQDADVGSSTSDARSAWDGLRKKALAQTVATATSASVANLLVIRKSMAKWGLDPADLAFIVGVSNMHTLLADTNLFTVDKFGPNATVLSGQIGSIAGVPVIASEHVREDLNASGVYDGITTTKTAIMCVNRGEWALGQRMGIDVEVDDSIYRETFQRVAVAFQCVDFQHIGDAATNDDTAIAYNVTV